MAPAYKFTYFDAKGAGEFIRLLFAYGGVEYEDIRINRADWPKIKESTPFGQVPLLEHNGKVVNQSLAIGRYVAKIVNLSGNDDWENLEIDAIADTLTDLRQKMRAVFIESDEEKKKILRETVKSETLPFYLSRFEERAKKNGGFLATTQLSWADIFFFSVVEGVYLVIGQSDLLDVYPNLKALFEKIGEIPSIKQWIQTRPATAL